MIGALGAQGAHAKPPRWQKVQRGGLFFVGCALRPKGRKAKHQRLSVSEMPIHFSSSPPSM